MKSSRASALVAATILLAGATHASADAWQTFRLDRAAIVGVTVLPAGTYHVDLAAARDVARFVQGKRTVAEAPCRVEQVPPVYAGNATHVRIGDDGQARLVKIVFASSKLSVEFPGEPTVAAEASAGKAAGGR
jgi:hypothetical protein